MNGSQIGKQPNTVFTRITLQCLEVNKENYIKLCIACSRVFFGGEETTIVLTWKIGRCFYMNVLISCPVCILTACGRVSLNLRKKAALVHDGYTFPLANTLQFLVGVFLILVFHLFF